MLEIFHEDGPFADVVANHRGKAISKASEGADPSILVVDDQRIIANTTTAILNRAGFRAITAYDGRTALQIATEIRLDFLLTDVMMPSMNGIELAIAVRKIHPETSILLFSGQAATKDMLDEARFEGYSFELVLKPIHPEELIGHLKALK